MADKVVIIENENVADVKQLGLDPIVNPVQDRYGRWVISEIEFADVAVGAFLRKNQKKIELVDFAPKKNNLIPNG